MTFRRTDAGLSNQHLFLKTDAIVFVEGGCTSFTTEEAIAGKQNEDSIDKIYWGRIFDIFCPETNVELRAIGSKDTLRDIAEQIVADKISNVYVAMDRDLDNATNSKIKGDRIVYTSGYSWENDVWNDNTLYAIFDDFSGNSRLKKKIKSEIRSCRMSFAIAIRWAIRADIVLHQNNEALLMNQPPDSVISLDAKGRPIFNRRRILSLLHNFNTGKQRKLYKNRKVSISPLRDCCGHTIATFFYRLYSYLSKQYINLPNIAKYYLNVIAISKFADLVQDKKLKPLHNYYKKQLST